MAAQHALLHYLNAVLLERRVTHTGRAASEQFVALCCLGERDDVAQGGGVAQQRHQPDRAVSIASCEV